MTALALTTIPRPATRACLSFVPARGGLCEQCQGSAAIGVGR